MTENRRISQSAAERVPGPSEPMPGETTRCDQVETWVPPKIAFESFEDFAALELAAAPLAVPGQCFNAGCSAPFDPKPGKRFCSRACKVQHVQEMRALGLKLAPAVLCWQGDKHAKAGTPEAARRRKAGTFISRLTRAVRDDRARRIAAALAKKGAPHDDT